jgi:hypothetical protein
MARPIRSIEIYLPLDYNDGRSANSTLAGAVENNRLLWGYLGVDPGTTDFGEWLRRNTERDHFFVDGCRSSLVGPLEVYLKAVLGPVFEGSLKDHFDAAKSESDAVT